MSLDWNTRNVVDAETVCRDPDDPGKHSLTTLAIVGASYVIGLWDLSAEEVDRWWSRVSFIQTLHPGAGFTLPYSGYPSVILTREDIEKHIGLTTNVFPAVLDAAFLKRTFEAFTADMGIKLEPIPRRSR